MEFLTRLIMGSPSELGPAQVAAVLEDMSVFLWHPADDHTYKHFVRPETRENTSSRRTALVARWQDGYRVMDSQTHSNTTDGQCFWIHDQPPRSESVCPCEMCEPR
jgi:hypothetical protein